MDIDFLRSAFAGDSVPEKNIALRKAHDEIERLRAGIAGARDSLERCFEPTVPLSKDASGGFPPNRTSARASTSVLSAVPNRSGFRCHANER
jgi:hypothetical protein